MTTEARSRRHREVRKKTEAKRHLEMYMRLDGEPAPSATERPLVRAECVDAPRPCLFVSCAHHLYLDVSRNGGVVFNFPDLEPDELPETCVLDLAERGGMRLEDIGEHMNITRERVRQLEVAALKKLVDPMTQYR